ncbi:MAG: peptidyl-prolyl cis-trans isomerase [Bacteroidales bacterium]
MRQLIFFGFSFLFFLLVIGCQNRPAGDEKNTIVEVAGQRLTREQLQKAIGQSLSKEDSTRLADVFVRNWIEETLLYEKAKNNINQLDEIVREAEDYKRRLIIFEYEKQLVNERLAAALSEQELEEFYQLHRKDFILEKPIVKGLFLKVPADAPQLDEVKKWMKKVNDDTLEKIEKYSLRNALVYEYFFDRWESLDQIMKNIPYEITNGNRFLKENKSLEVARGDHWYYLFIKTYKAAGEEQPYEYARGKIREKLLNQKKKGFIRTVEEELYQKALRDNKIVFYGKESEDSEIKNIN